MKIDIPKFETQKELHDFLIKNHDDFIYQKKNAYKEADACGLSAIILNDDLTRKSETNDKKSIKVRAIINTTMVMDSHKDVHINGLWKKSLKENKRIRHVREHKSGFENIISDKGDLKAFTKIYTWKDLGYDKEGNTEALVFDSNVKESRNPFMFKQYKDGNVDNHSVGMYYVDVKFALNSKEEDATELKAEYDKHINNIANKDEVEKQGYFWAVYEAKVKEGSAVTDGSNSITPTLSPKEAKVKISPEKLAINKFLNIE